MHWEECIESTICVWLGVGLLYQMWTLLEAILLKQRSWPSTPIQVFILITKKTHKTSQKFNQLCSTELDCVPGDSTSQASAKDGDQVIALFSQSAKFLQSGAKFTNFFSSTPKPSHGSSSWKHLNRYIWWWYIATLYAQWTPDSSALSVYAGRRVLCRLNFERSLPKASRSRLLRRLARILVNPYDLRGLGFVVQLSISRW